MSRAGLSFGASLVRDLNPLAVGQAMEQFNRVAQQKQQQDIFTNLLRQHNIDLQQDSIYRRDFNALAKKNPNALMSSRNLSQIRAQVGAVKQNIAMVGELEKRVDAFAASPQGQAIGFNAEFKKEELRRISKMIRENPEIGNQALFQEMSILSAAMQSGQRESTIQNFFTDTQGQSAAQQLGALDELKGIPFSTRDKLQNFLLKRNAQAQASRAAEIKALGAGGSAGFKLSVSESTKVKNENDLQNFKAGTSDLVRSNRMTPDEKIKADKTATDNFEDVRGREDEQQKQVAFAQNVDSLVTRMAADGATQTPEGLAEWLGDAEDNKKFFKELTGFDSIGDARSGIQNFDEIIQTRFQSALQIGSVNENVQENFAQEGGITTIRGKTLVDKASDIEGTLVIPTTGSNVAVYSSVPPMKQVDTAGGFFGFLSKDDRGLPGVTGLRLASTTVPDRNGQPVVKTVPSFDAIQTRQTNSGDQLVFSYLDVFTDPTMINIPVQGGKLNQAGRKPLNIAEYARDVINEIDPDEDDDRNVLLLKSVTDFRDGIKKEMKKSNKSKREELGIVLKNVENLMDTMQVTSTQDLFSVAPEAGETGDTFDVTKAKELSRGTVAERNLMIATMTRYLIEYGRFNAVMTNSFVDRPVDARTLQNREGAAIISGGSDEPFISGGGELQDTLLGPGPDAVPADTQELRLEGDEVILGKVGDKFTIDADGNIRIKQDSLNELLNNANRQP